MTDEQQVLTLREQGLSYRQIMADTGLSRGRVGRIIKAHKDAPSLTNDPAGPSGSSPASVPIADVPPSRPEGPATSTDSPGPAGVGPSPGPTSSAPAGRGTSPTDKYASAISSFIAETRETLQAEPGKLVTQTVEGLLADLEARSQQALKALRLKLTRMEQEKAARPDRTRRHLADLGRRLVQAQARVQEAELEAQKATTEWGQRKLRRILEKKQEQVASIQKAIAWREGELAKAEAACSN